MSRNENKGRYYPYAAAIRLNNEESVKVSLLREYAMFKSDTLRPQKVKSKRAVNSIFDMNGNVAEWCWSKYGNGQLSKYSSNIIKISYSPHNEENTLVDQAVLKGGSWANDYWKLRISNRTPHFPNYKDDKIGFRVVRSIPDSK